MRAERAHSRGVPEFFRGDAWQLLLREPGQALRVARYIRALLSAKAGVKHRISMEAGELSGLIAVSLFARGCGYRLPKQSIAMLVWLCSQP